MKFGKKIKNVSNSDLVVGNDCVSGPGWSVTKLNEQYVFEYISGELNGTLKKQKITKTEFKNLCTGEITDNDILLNYNLTEK